MGLFSRKNKDQSSSLPPRRLRAPAVIDETQLYYQRGRTLSPYNERTEEQSERSRAHALASRRRHVLAALGVVSLVIVVFGVLLFQLTASVKVAGDAAITKPVNESKYQTIINQYLDAHPIERLRFALNQTALSAYVSQQAPEVEKVSQAPIGEPTVTTFTLTMRQPVADWEIGGHRYYVDASGVAFDQNYYNEPDVQIIDQSGSVPTGEGAVTSTSFLGFIGRVMTEAGSRGYKVTQVILPAGTTREVNLQVSGVGATIKLTVDRGPAEQVEDMANTLKYMSAHGISPSYIDVRVAGRAYYK